MITSSAVIVVQSAPFSRGETAVEQASDIKVEESGSPAFLIGGGAKLSDIVDAINRIGVPPGDLVAILEALDQAGALPAGDLSRPSCAAPTVPKWPKPWG